MINFLEKFDPDRIGVATYARKTPEKPALIMNDSTTSFGELDSNSNKLANALLKLGIAPGDRIAILMHNSPGILEAWCATGKMGVTPIVLNYRFKGDEIAYIIGDSESRALIYAPEFEETVSAAKSKLTDQSPLYVCTGEPSARSMSRVNSSSPPSPVYFSAPPKRLALPTAIAFSHVYGPLPAPACSLG